MNWDNTRLPEEDASLTKMKYDCESFELQEQLLLSKMRVLKRFVREPPCTFLLLWSPSPISVILLHMYWNQGCGAVEISDGSGSGSG